ncbi:MAG: hypothetical protein ACYC49_16865 [Ignavibacteriaceae bacterium]
MNSFISSRKKIGVSELTKKRFLPANPANGADPPVEMTFWSCATASTDRYSKGH